MTVIKAADDKQPQLDALNALLERPDVDTRTRKEIEKEIWTVRAGVRGEREAAYEIDFHYARRDGYMVVHDLRIDVGGRIAQVDHLLINRVLDIWVCETKAFGEGVKINDRGEWLRYGPWHARGMESPVRQNARHVEVLREAFDSGAIQLPRRLGILPIKPTFHPVVLVSNNAKIDRPRTKRGQAAVDGLDSVIKIEQLVETINRSFDERNPFRLGAKVVGVEAIEEIARQLVGMHQPATFDWPARFGLPPMERTVRATPTVVRPSPSRSEVAAGTPCVNCGKALTDREAEYLHLHADRFASAAVCYRCQRSTTTPRTHSTSEGPTAHVREAAVPRARAAKAEGRPSQICVHGMEDANCAYCMPDRYLPPVRLRYGRTKKPVQPQ